MFRSKPCRYILNKESCPFGKKCRFLHEFESQVVDKKSTIQDQCDLGFKQDGHDPKVGRNTLKTQQGKGKTRECQFFLRSHCRYGDSCKFVHSGRVEDVPKEPIEDRKISQPGNRLKNQFPSNEFKDRVTYKSGVVSENESRTGMIFENGSRTGVTPENGSRTGVTSESRFRNRVTSENKNLTFENNRVESKSKSKGSSNTSHNPPPLTLASFIGGRGHMTRPRREKQKELSNDHLREVELEQLQARFPGEACGLVQKSRDAITYQVYFAPTDQEWCGPSSILLKVTFPESYPMKYCHIELSPDQDLEPQVIDCGNKAINDYWQPDMLGGLMFRPFLHWWDKNIVTILQSPFSRSEETKDETCENVKETIVEEVTEEDKLEQPQPVVKSKKGTEIRLLGLDISETLGTAFWTTLKVALSCSRCKNHQEAQIKEEQLYSITCDRCNGSMTVIYHLSLIHSASSTLGYLELSRCTPVEVVFQSSPLTITCLNCSSEIVTLGFFIGQPKDVHCRRCHTKITLNVRGIRFVQHQQSDNSEVKGRPITVVSSAKKRVDKLLKDGEPLPNTGTCEHYKKSHRWLRFPCCGRAFPCDTCHDAVQDHPMERATRMICGYCSKEQAYSGKGICVRCLSDMTLSKHSSHWEGGQGCRNKSKMSRQDKHKYKDTNKTTCMKSERVGKKQT